MSNTTTKRRCRVCEGFIAIGDVCPRCRARHYKKPGLLKSAWMLVGAALMLLVALAWWSNSLSSVHENDDVAALDLSIVADGTDQPGESQPVGYEAEKCVPWAVSKTHKPPPENLSYLVVNSKMSDPGGLVLAGFAEECGQNLKVLVCEDIEDGRIQQVVAASPQAALIAVGKNAVLRAQNETDDVPILFAKLVDPHTLNFEDSIAAGVSPWVPTEPMMRHILNILPRRKDLAFIYPAGPFEELAKQAADLSIDVGRQAVIIEIADRKQLDQVLTEAESKAKAWVVFPDRRLINQDVFRQILVRAERSAIPVGVSDEDHVRRGALVGVGPDSYHIGKQLCRLAGALYRGGLSSKDRVFCPEYSFAVINNAVVEKLGYTLDLSHVKQAKLYKWH